MGPLGHYKEICECGNTLGQCICPAENKTITVKHPCKCVAPKKPLENPYLATSENNWQITAIKNLNKIIAELTDYCEKFTVPLPVKELKKILGIET